MQVKYQLGRAVPPEPVTKARAQAGWKIYATTHLTHADSRRTRAWFLFIADEGSSAGTKNPPASESHPLYANTGDLSNDFVYAE